MSYQKPYQTLVNNVIRNEKSVKTAISGLQEHFGITGFTYFQVNKISGNFSLLTSHGEVFKKYLQNGHICQTPFLMLPKYLPDVMFNDRLLEVDFDYVHQSKEFMQDINAGRVFILKKSHEFEHHFASFYSESGDITQINEFVMNIQSLSHFTDLFASTYKSVLSVGSTPIVNTYTESELDHLRDHFGKGSYSTSNELIIPESIRNSHSVLTKQEVKMITLYADGNTANTIAEQCNLSRRTVENYIYNAKIKIGCRTKTDICRYILTSGLRNTEVSFS